MACGRRRSHRAKPTSNADADGEGSRYRPRAPRVRRRLDQAERDGDQARGAGQHAGHVEAAGVRIARLADRHRRAHDRDDGEGEVHPEHRRPAEEGEQDRRPATGPAPNPVPPTAAQVPMAPARVSAGNVSVMIDSVSASMAAPPIPCTGPERDQRRATRRESAGRSSRARRRRRRSGTPACGRSGRRARRRPG